MEFIDIGLYVAYGLLIIGIALAVIMPLVNSFSQPKSLAKIGAGIATLVVLFIIGYAISDSSVVDAWGISEGTSKFVGGLLITMYILFVLALIGIVITELNKAIK